MDTHFKVQPNTRDIPNPAILAEIRSIAAQIPPPQTYLSYRDYRNRGGRFSAPFLVNRFGSWNNTLARAGLPVGHRCRIPDIEFFTRLESLWRKLGRRPSRNELDYANIGISGSVYIRRFGSWSGAINAFAAWVNSPHHLQKSRRKKNLPNAPSSPKDLRPHPNAHPLRTNFTPRTPSMSLRHRIFRRDYFKCTHCGRSPATDPCVILHIDHIHPWSKGGATVPENLQTLCDTCNRRKAAFTST